MKHRATKRPRLTAPLVRSRTGKQQESDFTAEGAPPAGQVALEPPALPEAEFSSPASRARRKDG